ncbi:hypothetical protein N9M10_00995 [Hellea sp.]|nr:hypothetical protein [Hellea sp.]
MLLKQLIFGAAILIVGGCQTTDDGRSAPISAMSPQKNAGVSSATPPTRLMDNIAPIPQVIGGYDDLKQKYLDEAQSDNEARKKVASQVLENFEMCERIYNLNNKRVDCIASFIPIFEDKERVSNLASYGVGGITCDGRWSRYANRDRDGDGIECEWGENTAPSTNYGNYSSGSTYVRGYYRKDGTYVRGHRRRK